MSESLPSALLGGALSAALIAGLSLLSQTTGASSQPARAVVQTDPDRAPVAASTSTCPVNASNLSMDARPDPGLSLVRELPVIPTYRSYMPAKVQVLVCPKTQECALPAQVPASLWVATDYRSYTRAPADAEVVSRGRCVELRWAAKADALWPGADKGVVQWAVAVGEPAPPLDPTAWRAGGGLVWKGDVVYAGEDGSPEVY